MVRTIDRGERRRAISEAVWRIIRRDGFDAASVRGVAAETSLSTGSVRHFFATQDELHVFAMEELIATMTGRVQAVLEASQVASTGPAPDASGGRKAVIAVLLELLPLTKEREELFLAYLQFVVKATVSPVLRPMSLRLAEETQELVMNLLQFLVKTGAARSDLDARGSAVKMNMLLDGITLRLLTAPDMLSREESVHLIEGCVDSWAVDA